jgi:hypothetical protein
MCVGGGTYHRHLAKPVTCFNNGENCLFAAFLYRGGFQAALTDAIESIRPISSPKQVFAGLQLNYAATCKKRLLLVPMQRAEPGIREHFFWCLCDESHLKYWIGA